MTGWYVLSLIRSSIDINKFQSTYKDCKLDLIYRGCKDALSNKFRV